MTLPTTPELIEQQRKARQRQIYDAVVLATVGVAPDVTMCAEFEIPPTLVPSMYFSDQQVIITRVRIKVTRFGSPSLDDDGAGWIDVEGYGQHAKANGQADERKSPSWTNTLPTELAAPLLLAAMTRTPVVKPVATQKAQ